MRGICDDESIMNGPLPYKFVDLQINGYTGVDFNDDNLAAEDLHRACERLRDDGVAGVLATIITDEISRMTARLARIAAICRQDELVREVVWGLHIEGPFINETPGYVGAHPPRAVRPADLETAKRLLDAADGLARLVTLAPERDPGQRVTRFLANQKVLVSAGHCDPSLDELLAAIDAGLSLFTHLGNGCPAMLPRHDNIIQRVLSLRDRLMITFIADGAHVPLPELKNYLRLAGIDRSIVVTDAISAARLGPGRYTIGGRPIDVGEDLIAHLPGSPLLMGSTATMPRMVALLREKLGLSDDDVERLVSRNPQDVLMQAASAPVAPATTPVVTAEPQYIDLAVNGYAGVDFNYDNLSAAELHLACERLREDGVAGILVSAATDEPLRMMARLARIASLRREDPLVRDVVWGIHLDGPFITNIPGYARGNPRRIVPLADLDVAKRLLDAAEGLVRMVTLAPECDPGLKVTRYLAGQNVLVSAGYCDPNLDELSAAIDAGLSMFTHLGNGCPALLPRHDNIIQRVLSLRDRLMITFIADGVHVPPPELKNYLRLAGIERSIVITAAISAARLGPGRYRVGPEQIDVGEDLVARIPDSQLLAGSTATMPRMAALLRERLGLSDGDIQQLVWDNPRRMLGQVAGLPAERAAGV